MALSVHFTPKIIEQNLVGHQNIMDAFHFVRERQMFGKAAMQPLDSRDAHIDKLTALLIDANSHLDRTASLYQPVRT